MAYFDLPLDQLYSYRPDREEPADFDSFWETTLVETRKFPLAPRFEAVDFGLKTVDTFDVTFNGYGGQAVKGWFIVPHGVSQPLPVVVEYIGYGGGRGYPFEWLLWASAGFASLVMDTRGQGSNWSHGDTPDSYPDGSDPHVPGFMTLGILSPQTYYYRRVFCDAVRAVETARAHTLVDSERVVVTGGSQGGGISIAVAGLDPHVSVFMPNVPYLCHFRRALEITDASPYSEIAAYCKVHREKIDEVFETLSYFDGVNLAARAQGRAFFSAGLMDEVCPPSTVFAAYNQVPGEKDIRVYPYNHHEGGGAHHTQEQIRYLHMLWD
jgi:cephalosporin-C deacetylase